MAGMHFHLSQSSISVHQTLFLQMLDLIQIDNEYCTLSVTCTYTYRSTVRLQAMQTAVKLRVPCCTHCSEKYGAIRYQISER